MIPCHCSIPFLLVPPFLVQTPSIMNPLNIVKYLLEYYNALPVEVQMGAVAFFAISVNLFSGWLRFRNKALAEAKIDHYGNPSLNKYDPKDQDKINKEAKKESNINDLSDDEIYNRLNKPFTAEECGGSTSLYDWRQTEEEIEVEVPLSSEESSTDKLFQNVTCKFTAKSLKLSFKGEVILSGDFYADVDFPECSWMIDNYEGSNTRNNVEEVTTKGAKRKCIWLMLKKKVRTERNGHWDCVIRGHDTIDTNKFGPQIDYVGGNDPRNKQVKD